MLKKIILTLFILSLFGTDAFSQNMLSVKVSGYIYSQDSTGLKSIPYVNVIHKRRHTGMVSDSSGFFSISLIRGDTLIFTSIGYGGALYILPQNFPRNSAEVKIIMKSKPYALQEVRIFAPPPVGPLRKQEQKVYVPHVTPKINPHAASYNSPISLLFNQFSREGRSRRKLSKLMAEDMKDKAYQDRLNVQYLGDLTGLQPPQLEEFVEYCKPDREFVLEADEYDLVIVILDYYRTFKQRNAYYK